MNTAGKTRILIVPLDWGLGHATRCIPLIREFIRQNCTVFIAGEGKTQALLQQEFPQLTCLPLKGYRVSYASKRWMFMALLVLQIPKIISAIRSENKWLKEIVDRYHIDAVLSDNRYGLYHPKIFSVFITHQLHIKTPFAFTDFVLQMLNYRFINRFYECWVPDHHNRPGLAGHLSHPAKMPHVPVRYMGPLSRFQPAGPSPVPQHLLILLSGPEPQRTVLENLLMVQIRNYKQPVIFVRGLPGQTHVPQAPGNISVVNHLPAAALQQVMLQATIIISRCGYSTIMDIVSLRKKSILIPTPGQTEQEYLARHLMKSHLALCMEQQKFSIQTAVTLAASFPYRFHTGGSSPNLKEMIEQFVKSLRTADGKD